MNTTTTGAPERRVLLGDAGAPLDTDRVLAIALRWADRPLTVEHVHVGQLAQPLDCVEVKWEGSLPIFALADGTRAWVERESGKSEAGRRVGLELGEVLLVETGQLTLEARVQKRSEKLVASGKRENVLFGLVVAHALMLFMAVTTAMVITPHTDDESIWGGSGFLRLIRPEFTQIPKHKAPELQKKIDDAIAKNPVFQQQPQQRSPLNRTALDVMRLLLPAAGGGIFGAGPNDALRDAADALGPGNGAGANGDGMTGRDMGNGLGGPGGPGGLGVGPLGVKNGIPGGFPNGLDKKPFKVDVCATCATTPPGYDRELVLKVVKRHQNQIRFCYETELNKNPELAGKVTVAWTIDGTGNVSVAAIAESGLKSDAVERCIVDRVRAWRFPEPPGGGEVAITFPWVFTTAGND